MNLEEMLDREAIRRLQHAYNIAGDRGRTEEMAAVFAPDGVLNYRNGVARGPAEIAAQLARRDAPRPLTGPDRKPEFIRHNLTTFEIVFDGPNEARGRAYFLVYSEIGPDHAGVYIDRYLRLDGGWKIAGRTVRIDWVAEGGHSVRFRPA